MKKTIVGKALPNIPWQKKPKGYTDVVWRYDKNPVIDRKPIKDSSRVFNSAIIPYKGEFIGVFRADHYNGYPNLHLGHSKDGLHWDVLHFVVQLFQRTDNRHCQDKRFQNFYSA